MLEACLLGRLVKTAGRLLLLDEKPVPVPLAVRYISSSVATGSLLDINDTSNTMYAEIRGSPVTFDRQLSGRILSLASWQPRPSLRHDCKHCNQGVFGTFVCMPGCVESSIHSKRVHLEENVPCSKPLVRR